MIHDQDPFTTVHLTGRDGLLSVVPTLLGFHPSDSAVLVALAGTRRRVGPVVRVGLSCRPTTGEATALISATSDAFVPYAEEAALIFYTDHPDRLDPKTAAKPLMARCPLIDLAIVSNTPRQIPDALLAATIGAGRRVMASRQELAQSVEYQTANCLQPQPLADFDTIARRDQFLLRAMHCPDVVADLITAAQATPDDDPRLADLCAVLAVLAYRNGDGPLAQVATGRSLRCNPQHRLGCIMVVVMAYGLPPHALDEIVLP